MNTFRIYLTTYQDDCMEFTTQEYGYEEAYEKAEELNSQLEPGAPYSYCVCPGQYPVFSPECIFQINLQGRLWIGELTREGGKIHIYAINYTNEAHAQNLEHDEMLRMESGHYLDMPVSNAEFLMKVLQIEIGVLENKI